MVRAAKEVFQRDLHRHDRVLQDRVDPGDGRHVDDVVATGDRPADRRHVPNIADDQLDIRVTIEPGLRKRVSPQDIQHPDMVVVC